VKYALAIGFGLLAATPALGADSAALDCPTGPIHNLQASLPVTASAIRRGEDIVIVAIGSSSTAGFGASDAAHSYPARLTHELQRRWPALAITVLNKGIGGETAPQMVIRFERDVIAHNPDLVIWQTGTNSLLRGESIESYSATLRAGIARLKQADADVILMDPQYAPKVLASSVHVRVVDTMRAAARELKIGLFPRFAAMKSWIESGRYAMTDLISPDSLHLNDTSYGCIARALAAGIAQAVRTAPVPMAVNTGAEAGLR
jgi:lysophospholipase L1-like esterase